MAIDTTDHEITMKLRRVALPELTDGRSQAWKTAGRHRAPASYASCRETLRKATTRASYAYWSIRVRVRPVWLRLVSALRAQWFRIWPPLVGMVAGMLIDLIVVAVIWHRLMS